MKLNIAEYVLNTYINNRIDKTALILMDDIGVDCRISYSALYHDVCCLMTGIETLAVKKGAVVGIQAAEVYDLLIVFLACNALGLVPLPLLLSLSQEELDYILQDSGAELFFCLHHKPYRNTSCTIIPSQEYQLLRTYPFQEMKTRTESQDPAFIFYTSGSSGKPKGVLHAQKAILGHEICTKTWVNMRPQDIVMQTDNMCWTYSMFTGFLDPIMLGATALVITASNRAAMAEDEITAEQWLNILNYYSVSIMFSTPNIYHSIVESPHFKEYKNPSLCQAASAGAVLADGVQQAWIKQMHFEIFIALGMSEASTFISTGPKVPYRKGKVGKIQEGRKVSILPLEEGFDPVPIDTPGMLAIHRDEPALMLSYLGSKKSIKNQYRGDWFLSQDIVSMDADGYIQYGGRADMIIKVDGGFRVSPIEIEHILKLHPAVLDAACGAIFDDKTSANQLIAYIVATQFNQEMADSIYQLLINNLSDYKIPTTLCFVEHLPVNARGKLIRAELNQCQGVLLKRT